jgi:TonB family protein
MRFALFLLVVFFNLSVFSQVENPAELEHQVTEQSTEEPMFLDSSEIFEFFNVNQPAKFGNGENDLLMFVVENIKYPAMALDSNIQGTVILSFIVEQDGSVTKVRSERKHQGFGLEEEAIRVVNLTSGLWTPAELREKKVRMRYRLPIKFTLK